MPNVFHQILVAAAPGDAVTNCAFEIRDALRRKGPSEIFASHIHRDLLAEVHHLSAHPTVSPVDPLAATLVHVSMGDDEFLRFVLALPGPLVISYHNVTPSHFFTPWSSETARLLESGRRSLVPLRDKTILALADSAFNAQDLVAAGYPDVRVGGLILGDQHLTEIDPDPVVMKVAAAIEGPVILSVGQLYPHKRPDFLLASLYFLLDRQPEAHLVLAGPARLPGYAVAVRRYVDRLAVGSHTTITGEIPLSELVAWYRSADLFVIASDHEGFSVPVVEAMLFEIPTVGRSCAAVPETMGDAGVLVPASVGPRGFATVMASVLQDAQLKGALRTRQGERSQAFSTDVTRPHFLDALEAVV